MAERRKTPIAVFAYMRAEHLQIALEALGRCEGYSDFDLHIYSDGPRDESTARHVEATRDVARHWVRTCGGTLHERSKNYCFQNIVDGVTELCDSYGRVIVVEDDIVVSPDFLTYMREGLDRYADNPKVSLVSGFMYALERPPKAALFFLPFALIWGWATWKRAWDHYSREPAGWQEFLVDPDKRSRFDVGGRYLYGEMLERTMRGEIDTWDIQWNYTVFASGGLGLYPGRSLVWNSGVGGGTHGASDEPLLDVRVPAIHGTLTREDFRQPRLPCGWALPDRLDVDEEAFHSLGECLATLTRRTPRKGGVWRAVRRWLRGR